ncbi:MAG: hypothetical protein ABW061_01415 [Polyangiaceae bacterium]
MKWRAAFSCLLVLVGCAGADPGALGGTAGNATTSTNQPTGTGGGAPPASGGQGGTSGAAGQAGLSGGGASGSAGTGSGGASPPSNGGSTSVPEECLRPYICVDTCGGEQQNFGCRACPNELIDTLYCPDQGTATGLFGTVNFLEGNQQPMPAPSSGTTTPVAREIRFYSPVSAELVEHSAGQNSFTPGLYSTIHGVLRAKAYSGEDGKYLVTLNPGKYSVFVEDGDGWYCNLQSSAGLCVVEVPESDTLKYNIDISYAAAF